MMKFLPHKPVCAILVFALFMTTGILRAQSIWENPIDGTNPNSTNPFTTGDIKDGHISVSGIGRGTGIAGNAGNDRYNATGWSTSGIDLNDYFSFTVTPNATYKVNFTSLEFNLQRSSTGPANFAVRSSIDNYAANITTFTGSGTAAALKTISLSAAAYQNLTSAVTFRVYGYTAGGGTGTASINDFVFNGTVVTTAVAPVITSLLTDTSVYNTVDTYTITASGAPTGYNATPLPAGATLSTNVISFSNAVAAGTYNITISATNAAGTDSKTLVYTRSKASQAITFLPDPIPMKFAGDAAFALSSTASSGLTVSYGSSDSNVATVSGNTVTIVGAGSALITASQAGNANYGAAANVSRTLTVGTPSITFTNVTPAGPFCSGTSNPLTVNFTSQGTFSTSFEVQHSDAAGNFPGANNANIIGSGTISPITATLPSSLASGNYKIRVINAAANVFSAANASDLVIFTNTWTGSADSNWNNAANWSCGVVPTATIAAVVAAASNQPVISGNINAAAKSLGVNSGAMLTVASGNTLAVNDAVSVTAGGSMTVENNANLLQVNNVTNSGTVTVRRNGLPLLYNDYSLWSSPVAGQNLQSFSPLTLAARFYTYNPVSDLYAAVGAPDATAFDVAKGYLIRMPNTGTPAYLAGTEALAFEGNFAGTPHNGNITIPLSTAGSGFNAIGNPYPSTLKFEAFIDANILNNDIEGQIWLWRKTNDSDNTSYATMTKAAYARNDAQGGGVPNSQIDPGTYELNVGQGFIVKSLTGTVTFNNAMRGVSYGNPVFRSAADSGEKSRFWLNLTSAGGDFSQMAVAYRDDATQGYDNGLDGRTFTNGDTHLYSFAEGIDLSIQARPQFADTDVVPLGFKVASAGNFIISIDNLDGLFATQDIFLKDNLDGSIHDLKASAYGFSSAAGTFNSRFEVVYLNPLGIENPVGAGNITVYKQEDRSLVIDAGKTGISGVSLYDIRGRLLFTQSGINATQTVIGNLALQQQVLIVQVTTLENERVSKKIIY